LQLPFDLSFFAIHFQFQLISDDALLLWGAMQFLNCLLRLCSTWFFLSVYSQGRDDLGMEVLLDAIQTCGSWKFLVILWNKMKQVASSSSAPEQTCDIMWLTEAYRAKVVPLWWSRKRHSVDSAQLVLKHNILNLWGLRFANFFISKSDSCGPRQVAKIQRSLPLQGYLPRMFWTPLLLCVSTCVRTGLA
jgi:hypothetical protein